MADDNERIAALETARIRDTVRAEAAQHGILDPTDLDAIGLDGVSISADGTVSGAKEFVQKWKDSKPHWFAKTTLPARMPDASDRVEGMGVKPGSAEAKKMERDYIARYSR